MDDRGHRRGPHRRAPTAGRRSTSGRTASGRTVSAPAPTAGRAARRRPSRSSPSSTSSPNKLGIDADRAPDAATWSPRATRWSTASHGPGLGHAAVLEAVAARIRSGRAVTTCRRTRASGSSFGVWPGGKDPAAAMCRLNADGTITITTGVVDMSGTTGAFARHRRRDVRDRPVATWTSWRSTRTARPQSPMSGGCVVTYSSGRAIRSAAADARQPDAGLRRARDGDRPGRPRDRRRRDPARRIAGSWAGRSPSSPRTSTTSAASSRRSRATPRPSRAASRPRPPRTSRTSAWIPRPARSRVLALRRRRRTSGVRSTRRSSRARCAVRRGAGHRLGPARAS